MAMAGSEVGPLVRALAPVAKPVGSWLWRKFHPDTSPSGLDMVADHLASKVDIAERRRLNELQVSQGLAIPVQFDELVRLEAPGSTKIVWRLSSIAPFYQDLGDLKRMVVVGEPGSGKTVLALNLILDLLKARKGPRDPVPVRFNATNWDESSSLLNFLVERLNAQYSVPRPVGRALVDSKRIIPVIDGLDEMDTSAELLSHAIAAVKTLNESSWRTYPLVVTCRTGVYERIRAQRGGAGIGASTIVGIKPLKTVDIVNYVQDRVTDSGATSSYVRALEAMTEKLEADSPGPLGVALQTPWMLTLALSYLDYADPGDAATLIHADSEVAIADQLFAAQIPAACAQQPGPADEWRYSESDVQRWMRAFAGFVSQTENDRPRTEASLDQLWSLAGERRIRRAHQLLAGLLAGLLVWLGWVQMFGLVGGLIAGLVFGLFIGWLAGTSPNPSRVYFRTHKKKELRTRLYVGIRSGLVGGLCIGMGFGLLGWFWGGLEIGIRSGLVVGLAYAAIYGLWDGLIDIPVQFRTPPDASKVIHDDLVAGVVLGLTLPLILGLAFGLSEGLTGGPMAGLMIGLRVLESALPMGLAFAVMLVTAAGRYSCAVASFRQTGLFAPRPAKFLEWSANAGLLRITGTSYQIRHDTYRQWLLAHPVPGPADVEVRTSGPL
jgi:hypothetical protein